MSRTTTGSAAATRRANVVGAAPPAAISVEIDLADVDRLRRREIRALRRSPAAAGRRRRATPWHRRGRRSAASAARPATRNGALDAARTRRSSRRRADERFDDALRVEEVDGASGADQCGAGGRAAPRERRRAPFAVGGEAAAGLEQPDVAPLAPAVVDARRRRSPAAATAAAPRTSPTADWRSRPARPPARRTGSAACRSMKANVTPRRSRPRAGRRADGAIARDPRVGRRLRRRRAPGTWPAAGRSRSAGRPLR